MSSKTQATGLGNIFNVSIPVSIPPLIVNSQTIDTTNAGFGILLPNTTGWLISDPNASPITTTWNESNIGTAANLPPLEFIPPAAIDWSKLQEILDQQKKLFAAAYGSPDKKPYSELECSLQQARKRVRQLMWLLREHGIDPEESMYWPDPADLIVPASNELEERV